MYDKTMIALGVIIILGLVGWFLLPLADKPQKVKEKIVYVDKSELRRKQAVDYLKEKKEITNDEYQKLTGVSDAQATRDLNVLEKQGIVEQIGVTGHAVKYKLK